MDRLIRMYNELMRMFKEITLIHTTSGMLNWDLETKLPPKGVNLRSEQLALLSGIRHKMITNPKIGSLLSKIEKHQNYERLNLLQRRNVYLVRKDFDEQTRLPEKLIVESERQRVLTINAWKKAKVRKDFSIFQPELEKLITLKKETANILMDVKKTRTPYDALLDIYEPKISSTQVTVLFNNLKIGLLSILEKCRGSPRQPDMSILKRKISIDLQQKISTSLAGFIMFDVESDTAGGRIDVAEHPFTSGYFDDIRITTHYYEDKFTSSIFSTLHEGGHALYEQNLRPEWMYQPVGASCSLGFHESQSRFVENVVGRSREFWRFFLPILQNLTGTILTDVDLDSLVFAINQVRASKIRVEADEITYGLHIIIRFELERDLMSDKIRVTELPIIWNQKYREYLDVEITDDSEGVMQDIHWASGLIGYFPTYALGNLYSGQILAQMRKTIPDWKNQIASGKFVSIKKWLKEHIYDYGNLYDPGELIKKITGEDMNIDNYLEYLNEKYSELYGF